MSDDAGAQATPLENQAVRVEVRDVIPLAARHLRKLSFPTVTERDRRQAPLALAFMTTPDVRRRRAERRAASHGQTSFHIAHAAGRTDDLDATTIGGTQSPSNVYTGRSASVSSSSASRPDVIAVWAHQNLFAGPPGHSQSVDRAAPRASAEETDLWCHQRGDSASEAQLDVTPPSTPCVVVVGPGDAREQRSPTG